MLEVFVNVKEAFKVLEEAASRGDEDFKDEVSSEYSHLLKLLSKVPQSIMDKATRTKEDVIDFTTEKAKSFHKSLHKFPWFQVGGTALLAGVCFILGRFSDKK